MSCQIQIGAAFCWIILVIAPIRLCSTKDGSDPDIAQIQFVTVLRTNDAIPTSFVPLRREKFDVVLVLAWEARQLVRLRNNPD